MADQRGDLLADLFDAQGRRVTATATGPNRSLLVILTATPGSGLAGGHPCLDRAQAATLRDALTDFIDDIPQEAGQ